MSRFARIFIRPLLAASVVLAPATVRATEPPPTESSATSLQHLNLPPVTSIRLDNGLTLVMEENHRTPFVAMHLRYAVGLDDEAPGETGVAALALRMMTTETKHAPAGTYDKTIDRIGGTDSGWGVENFSSSLRVTVPKGAVSSVLWLWSDQMGFFDPQSPKALDDGRAAEKRYAQEAVGNLAYGAVQGFIRHAIDPKRSADGKPGAAALTLDDVRRFKDRFYVPDRAVLAVSGDFQPDALVEQVRRYFGPIAPSATVAPPEIPTRMEHGIRLEVAANVQAARVTLDWSTPAFYDAGDAELDVVARVLAGINVPILHWRLVDQLKVATSVTARQRSRTRRSDFQITAFVANGHSPNEVIEAIDSLLVDLRRDGLKEDFFRRAREEYVIGRLNGLDRGATRASLEAQYASLRNDAAWLPQDLGRYEAMTLSDVNLAIQRWLPATPRVVTVVTVDRTAPPGGVLRGTRVSP